MRYFIGVIIVLVGVTALLQTSGIIVDPNIKDSVGSGLIMAVGLALFIWKRQAWVWALIIFLVGLTDLVENQQWPVFEKHTPWEYVWPVLVIIFGVHLILKRDQKTITNNASEKRRN